MEFLEKLTMDAVEEMFVTNFFVRERRERALFELKSKKKRRNFFSDLYEGSAKLDQRFISEVKAGDPRKEHDFFTNFLNARHAEKMCYSMSDAPEMDRQFVSLSDGLAGLLAHSMVSVLVCGERLALLHGEANISVQPFWLLEKKKP